MEPRPVDRRRALKLAAVALAATATGCSTQAGRSPSATPASPSPPPSPPPSPTRPPLPSPAPSLAPVVRWSPSAAETLPDFKRAAADLVQAVCTRASGESVADSLERAGALLAPGFDQLGALSALAPLGEGSASAGDVLYPQFGGLQPLSDGAATGAAIVVVRQRLLAAGGSTTAVVRTLDVRLSRVDGRWLVSAVPNGGGEPVDRPADLPPPAVRVLDDPALFLPDTARWDVHAGRISAGLLGLLADATALGDVAVTVFATGHPREVFSTRTVSAHTAGRAVDVWRLGGLDVVDDRSPGGPVARLQAAALLDARTSQVGSPPGTDQDGPGRRRSFTDLVHEDHLHLAARS